MGDMKDTFKQWDKGKLTFTTEVAENLTKVKTGECIGDVLKKSTICPVRNSSCLEYIQVVVYKFHPRKGGKQIEIMICPLGVSGNGDKCPLNY